MTISEGNAEMAKAWDGEEGAYWAAHAERFDQVIAPYYAHFQGLVGVAPGERVLDIGCGNGRSTVDAARAAGPGGAATGADLSGAMLEVARGRAKAEGVVNATFVQADAQVHPFGPAAYDVAISRFGVMFFADPEAAFANLSGALRAGGRMCFLAWQDLARNEWVAAMRAALAAGRDLPAPPPGAPGPFSLADPAQLTAILGAAGLKDVTLTDVREPFVAAADAEAAFSFVSSLGMTRALLAELDDDERRSALGRLRAVIDAHVTPGGVTFESAAWLVSARR